MQEAARPEPESEASNSLPTSWLYQSAVLGLEVGPLSVIVGALVSMLTTSEAVCELPAVSSTEQPIVCVPSPETEVVQLPAPAAVSVSASTPSLHEGAPARPEPESEAVTVSVTEVVLFQPAPFELWLTASDGSIESWSVVSSVTA